MEDKLIIEVSGEPISSFGRSSWKEKITYLSKNTDYMLVNPTGVNLLFRVSRLRLVGPDVDNLSHNVFASLFQAGWFHGRKSNIKWWTARREIDSQNKGVTIIGSTKPIIPEIGQLIFDGVFCGEFPQHSNDNEYVTWVEKQTKEIKCAELGFIGIALYFGSKDVSIGEISTGRIKNLIDGLHPLIGHDDTKVKSMIAIKEVEGLEYNEVHIQLWKEIM
jgi:hypothetical protein